MSSTGKKVFLAISIILPFVIYCVYYYGIMIKNAPYRFSELEYIAIQYGPADSLVNDYNSKTKVYHYVSKSGERVTTKVKLNKSDLLYLHRKAVELGFWNFPEELEGPHHPGGPQPIHFIVEYKYKHKTKKVIYDTGYEFKPQLGNAAKLLVQEVMKRIDEAEKR